AEDGIRDDLVTGVQTCALPIYFDFRFEFVRLFTHRLDQPRNLRPPPVGEFLRMFAGEHVVRPFLDLHARGFLEALAAAGAKARRSEERRGGTECRSRRSRGVWE